MKELIAVVQKKDEKHKQGPPKQNPPQLSRDQCAICKKT